MGSTRLFAVVWVSISLLAPAEMQTAASADCAGAVVDENSVPVGAAQVKFENSAGKVYRTETDAAGRFVLQSLPAGDYRVEVRKEGFFLLSGQSFSLHDGRNELTLTLNHVQELHEQVQVIAPPNQIDTQDTSQVPVSPRKTFAISRSPTPTFLPRASWPCPKSCATVAIICTLPVHVPARHNISSMALKSAILSMAR